MCAPNFAGMIGILSRPEWAGFMDSTPIANGPLRMAGC
jgi:hypothetical protein